MTSQLPNNPHRHAISVRYTLAHNNDSPIKYAHLVCEFTKDDLRIGHFGIAIAATNEQSLWAWLQDPKGQGEGKQTNKFAL